MNIEKFLSEGSLTAKSFSSFSKVVLVLLSVLLMFVSVPLRTSAQQVQDSVQCAPKQIPYMESFDTCTPVALTAIGVVPECWETVFAGSDEKYRPHVTNDANYSIVNNSLVIFSANQASSIGSVNYAVLPVVASELNGLEFSFKAKRQDWIASGYNFSVGYFNGELLPENYVLLEDIAVRSDVATTYTFSLNGRGIPQGARLAFRQQGGQGTGFYAQTCIDSIFFSFLPCADVTNVQVSDGMMTTAHVSWTPGAWERAWRVEYGESGFTPGTGTVVMTDTVACDLSDLNGETTYDVYVQAVCDTSNMSGYSVPASFYTYCSVLGDTTVGVGCDSFEWRDSVYTFSGTYYDTVPRAAAEFCDSIYTLQLTIHNSVYRFDTLVLCQDQLPYQWHDTTFEVGSHDSSFVFTYATVHTCDSIVELALFVNLSYYEERYDTICENDLPYTWNDTVFDEGTVSGDYLFVRQSQFGCDSIVTLHLTVHDSYEQMELFQVCSQELPVVWRDTTFGIGTQSGVFTFYRHSLHGCDSIVTLALYVIESDTVPEEDTICASQLPYVWGDTTFEVGTTTGIYLVRGNLNGGCVNTLLHLVVGGIEQDINHPDTVQVCRNDLPFVWHGNLGDYTFGTNTNRGRHQVTVSAGGCTDTYYVFVDILENGDAEVEKTICSSQLPFTTNDTTFLPGTQSGTYFVTRPAGNGCDRMTTIHLTVNPAYTIYDTLTICKNELPYRWRNEWIQVGTTTGDYTYNRQTAIGCDSIVRLHLTVNLSYSEEISMSVCENELPVVWRGHIIPRGTQSQIFTFNETSVTGCDSIVKLNLTVNPTYRHEETLTICGNELPYTWRDTTFAEGTLGGTYLFEKQSVYGCDSIVILHLRVNPVKEENVTVDICRSELPYTWRDTVFAQGTNSGTFVFQKATAANCDSTVTLTLNIHESFGGNESLVVCENELPVEWRGHVIPRGTRSGDIVYREHTVFGCDSIVILSVVVTPSYRQSEELTICENDLPYEWRDTVFERGTRGGVFYFEKSSVSGCDSTVVLKLTVNPSFSRTEELTLCDSEFPYEFGDTTFEAGTESGTFVLRRTTAHGCDSVVTLNITVNPTYALSDELQLCASEFPYVYGDTVFGVGTQSGTFVLHRRTRTGCDSTITLSMTVYPLGYLLKEYAICTSELPYTTEDTTFPVGTVSGVYSVLYRTTSGCDSTVEINLTVRPVYNEVVSEVICENDLPYTWRDTNFLEGTRSGVFTFVRATQFGCDSVVTLALIVNPSYEQEEEADVCSNGFPFVWRDTSFLAGTVSGDYTFYRRTVNGCDSIVTLHLTVNPTYNQNEQLSVCQSDLPYQWRDTTFQVGTPSGFYTFRRASSSGCDSTVTLALTVYPSSTQSYNVRICSNDLPYVWSVTDTTFGVGTVSGTYLFHYENVLGCDSNIVLYLTVNQSYETIETLTLCQNDLPYYYEPGNYTFSTSATSGVYPFNNTTESGCDSTITLHLTIHPSYLQQEMVAVCENDFPFTWRDTTFEEGTESGTYVFTRTSQFGCDSVVSLMLAISPLPSASINTIPNGTTTTLLCNMPGNCTCLWSTGSESIMITVPTDSLATYMVTVTNSNTGCSNTASVTIGVGIEDNPTISHDVIVFPNPTDGKVTVKANDEMISEITVFTMEGRLVKRVRVAETETNLDLDSMAKGSYLLQIQLQTGDVVRKKLIVR